MLDIRDKEKKFIEELLEKLTLEEKIGMVHGAGLFRTEPVPRLDIPAIHFSDGPMGVRFEFVDNEWEPLDHNDDFVTYLPCNSALASTWNVELARKTGQVLGEETRGRGKDMILAPGINIKRNPLCGRNFEYMSEDPRLIEEMVVPMVEGIQENDVSACVKHFAANSQEKQRLWVDTLVDERTLQEIYYPGFKAAIEKADLYGIMGAYNRLNGEHCCTSESLLNKVLRQEWNYDGLVVSDWGGVHDTLLAAKSALDVEMDVTYDFSKHYMADSLIEKIKTGEISEELLDEKVRNILKFMLRLKMIGDDKDNRKCGCYNTREHANAALEVARESIVLLKNDEKILPINPENKKIAVIGANATMLHADGGGSAEIKALYEISPLMGIKMLLGGNQKISYEPGYYAPKISNKDISWQADSTKDNLDETDNQAETQKQKEQSKEYLDKAIALAKESDVVIFVGGLDHAYDVEGKDRTDMKLPYGQDEVIEELLKIKPDMTIVMYAGSPVEMPWLNEAKALVWSYYNGMEGGNAIAEVLFGKENPSAKLAETFIKAETDCPARTGVNFGKPDKVQYTEGVMVGYRHYDTEKTEVNFCFGHGLSYTDYEYSALELNMVSEDDNMVEVSFDIKNVGDVSGKEIVQVYVAPKFSSNISRPCHELKGFAKILLNPGQKKSVAVNLSKKDFAYYDVLEKDFVVIPGEYEIQIGASSRDIRLSETINIK